MSGSLTPSSLWCCYLSNIDIPPVVWLCGALFAVMYVVREALRLLFQCHISQHVVDGSLKVTMNEPRVPMNRELRIVCPPEASSPCPQPPHHVLPSCVPFNCIPLCGISFVYT